MNLKICGKPLNGGRQCTKFVDETGNHVGGCEGPVIIQTKTEELKKQSITSVLVNCPTCHFPMHFSCEVNSTYSKWCSVCRCQVVIQISIGTETDLKPEQVAQKRNQHRG